MAKLHAVVVVDCADIRCMQFNSIAAFSNDQEGQEQAENCFCEWVRDTTPEAISPKEMGQYLDRGFYELGDGFIAILSTE